MCGRLLSGRDYHALMRENGAFDFAAHATGGNVRWATVHGPSRDRGAVVGPL